MEAREKLKKIIRRNLAGIKFKDIYDTMKSVGLEELEYNSFVKKITYNRYNGILTALVAMKIAGCKEFIINLDEFEFEDFLK